jgi:hypothetical protein
MFQLFSLVILILDVIVMMEIWKSTKDMEKKILWTVAVIFLPVLGLIIYYFIGRK